MIRLRDARPNEAPLLTEIAARSKAHWPYDAEYLRLAAEVTVVSVRDVERWPHIVACDGDRVVGFAAVAPVGDDFMLDHLWIEPSFIGGGIGRKLFAEACVRARAMGWTKMLIASDPYAEDFYLRMGCKRVGQRESKVRKGLFLPLMSYDLGLMLIGDSRVRSVPISENGEPLVDLAGAFNVDLSRSYVQKKARSISWVRRSLAERLVLAESFLPTGVRLLIKEGHRPMFVQREHWDGYSAELRLKFPEWTEQQVYDECSKLNAPLDVAPHTTGAAIDLTLIQGDRVLDLGTVFNAEPLATDYATYTCASNISAEARANRLMLMSAMSKAGFVNYPTEWWHWSYGDKYWAVVTGAPSALYSTLDEPT